MYIDVVKLGAVTFELCDKILSHLTDIDIDNVDHDDNVVCDSVIVSEETIQE